MAAEAEAILAARRPEDLFGDVGAGALADRLRAMQREFRRLAAIVHPDKESGSTEAFVRLQELRLRAERSITTGTYGTDASAYARFAVRGREYELHRLHARGDLANVFLGEVREDDETTSVALKVCRDPRHGALIQHEARVLKRFASDDAEIEAYRVFVPRFVDAFAYRRATVNRQAVALGAHGLGWYTLEQVREAYPVGVDWRDAVWMLRRLLAALAFAHANDVVHAAVLPEHVLIHAESHNLVLCDWTCSVTGDATVRTLVSRRRDWYPLEVIEKEQPGPETDVFMAMRTMVHVLGGDGTTGKLPARTPVRLRAFIAGCTQERRSRRPDSALGLLAELDELLGRRRFRPFKMPSQRWGP